jgi:hypothetical protein
MTPHVKGKTFWIGYAVRRRLGEEEPFLLYRNRECYIFVKDGVFRRPAESVSGAHFEKFLWAFIEGDEHDAGVPEGFLCNDTNLYIIFPTSPKALRWKPLIKFTYVEWIIMNPWSLGEMQQA